MEFNPVFFGIIIGLTVMSPMVHVKKGKKYSFPLAGLAVALLAFQIIS